jgi:hypothetical protein
MKHSQLKQLIKEEIKNILNESIDMRKVYLILKNNGYGPRVIDGNRITGIKAIEFGSYNPVDKSDWGMLVIDQSGDIDGADNWGFTIKNADEILNAIKQFRKDQTDVYGKQF